jgi:uncharacterized protein
LYPREYLQYLVHFHGDRDYFECHEILEEYGKKKDPGNKHSIWVGFIQLAVSNYHHRRGNFNGAKKTLKNAMEIFLTKANSITTLGLESQTLIKILGESLDKIEQNQVYKSIQLPIYDGSLLNQCKLLCEKAGYHWGANSDISDLHLVHMHKLRDRTNINQIRKNALLNRKGNE